MDIAVILLQRFRQHSSPTAFIEPDPIVYHILYCPDETLRYVGVCERDDLSDTFTLKNFLTSA